MRQVISRGFFDDPVDIGDISSGLEAISLASGLLIVTGGPLAPLFLLVAVTADLGVVAIDIQQGATLSAALGVLFLVFDGAEIAETVVQGFARRVARSTEPVAQIAVRRASLDSFAGNTNVDPDGLLSLAEDRAADVVDDPVLDAALAAYTGGRVRAAELEEIGVTGQDAIAPLARFDAAIEQTLPAGSRAQFRADLEAISSETVAAGATQFGRRGLTDTRLQEFAVACRATNSFGAQTLVPLADGSLVRIADVLVGDEILAFDLDANRPVGRAVTATLPHTDWLLEAHFSHGTTMSVTEDHRFWSVTDADWVELQDLDTTDQLLTPDGATVTVDWLDWDAGVTAPAFDLTVEQEHNFFVTAEASGEPILVHNQTLQRFACGATASADTFVRIAAAEDALDAASRVQLAAVADTLSRVIVPDTVGGTRSLLDVFVEQLEPVTSTAELRRVLAGGSFGPNVTSAALSTGRVVDILGHPRFVEAASSATPEVLASRIATKPLLDDATIDAVRTADPDFAVLGISNDIVIDNWRLYSGALEQDAWLASYVRIRKNSFSGSQFERDALVAAGVPVGSARRPLFDFNGVSNPGPVAGREGFIPDHVQSVAAGGGDFLPPQVFDHWRFIEEVKNLSGSLAAGSTSNTASQLEWLLRQEPGPSGLRGELDLYVGQSTTFTGPFLQLVADARAAGVTVSLFREIPGSNPVRFVPDNF